MDHFANLDIETIHLTPMFETTARDMGYDITDYYKVDSRLGTMDDFDELVREMNKRSKYLPGLGEFSFFSGKIYIRLEIKIVPCFLTQFVQHTKLTISRKIFKHILINQNII